jgi:sporulation protein YlmC with PRC-barrel domain
MEQQVAHDETNRLISASKVEGTAVYNSKGEKLGTVETVMIDKLSGKVAYAVMSFGGFLGLGDKHHPLPWNVLKYDTGQDGYLVNLDKETLEKAPSFGPQETAQWGDDGWNRKVHEYYNATPYWV